MSGFYFYIAIGGFASGIFLRSFFDISIEVVVLIIFLSGIVFVIGRRGNRGAFPVLMCVGIFLLSISFGVLRVDSSTWKENQLLTQVNKEIVIEGIIVREPDVRLQTVQLYVQERKTNELVLVTTDRFQNLSYGDKVVAEGVLELPSTFETDLGRTFKYPEFLRARGVEVLLPLADVTVVGTDAGNAFVSLLLQTKHRFMRSLETVMSEPQAGLGEGLLLGVKRALGEDLEDAFRRVGIIHIVVLSGYNIMIVADAIMRFLSLFFNPRIRMVIGMLTIGTFALMVGLSATVVRASIMATLVLFARATGRTTDIMRSLMFAGFIMLLINPYLLAFDPGFQLSFLATLGLILLAPYIETKFRLVPTKYQIREFMTATVSTQIMVLPILLYLMGTISVVAVVVNVLVLPMVPLAMGLTFATGVISFISIKLGLLVGYLGYLSLTYIVVIAEMFAKIPYAAFPVPVFPFWVVALAYVGIGLGIWKYGRIVTETAQSNVASLKTDIDLRDWIIENEADLLALKEKTQ